MLSQVLFTRFGPGMWFQQAQYTFVSLLSKVAQFTVSAAFATRVALPSMAFAMWAICL